jgi:glycosyltransferase involved in cell wall biosynthesis
LSRHIAVVPVGMPGLDAGFAEKILPQRRARILARQKILAGEISSSDADKIVNVLFLAHCTREKGVFDAVAGVALANEKFAAENAPLQFRLTLVGAFASEAEEKELREFIRQRGVQNAVEILGFVSAERKAQALADADIFCFPTFYLAENQPGTLIEAMACGLPIVTTRWRSIPEMLPENYPGLVDPKSPEQIAAALRRMAANDFTEILRELFLKKFTLEQHLTGMAAAIRSVETEDEKTE